MANAGKTLLNNLLKLKRKNPSQFNKMLERYGVYKPKKKTKAKKPTATFNVMRRRKAELKAIEEAKK